MSKKNYRFIHGISVDVLLKDLWNIQMLQRIYSSDAFTWTEMLLCEHFTEQYDIRNENSQFYEVIETLFLKSPLAPPSMDDILKECENRGILGGN